MIDAARRDVAVAAIRANPEADDPAVLWVESGGERVARVRDRLTSLIDTGDISVSKLTVASGLMADLSI